MFISPSIGQLPHSSSGMSCSKWVLDSGASHHRSLDSSSFTCVPFAFHSCYDFDGTPMPLVSVGSVITPHLSFPNVYLIWKLKWNLAFVGHLCDSNDYLVISSNSSFCYI